MPKCSNGEKSILGFSSPLNCLVPCKGLVQYLILSSQQVMLLVLWTVLNKHTTVKNLITRIQIWRKRLVANWKLNYINCSGYCKFCNGLWVSFRSWIRMIKLERFIILFSLKINVNFFFFFLDFKIYKCFKKFKNIWFFLKRFRPCGHLLKTFLSFYRQKININRTF